ncbi:MAG: hypothetical protein BroJett029_30190 [Alphaproteobacteria bacterium]|nr:MAG: hypothetical protein BroJett029_30190 [Alphaproteobacteria bacterium]
MRIPTLAAWVFGFGLIAGISPASAIDVTSLNNGLVSNQWMDGTSTNATRNGGSTTISNAPGGDGALRLSTPNGSGKATAVYYGSSPLGTLGNLSTVKYGYYRDSSSTNAANQAPSIRLYVQDPSGRTGTLVYEPVYNGVTTVPEDSWQSVNATGGKWWLFENGVFENFGLTLSDWRSTNTFTGPGGPKSGFGENALILGIDVGIGSGWDGFSLAFVDNVELWFTVDDKPTSVSWNFVAGQTEVPEPATLALMGAGLAGFWMVRRRRSV